jgi:hypothetical protein
MSKATREDLPRAFLSEGEPKSKVAKFKKTRESKWNFPSAASLDDACALVGMLYAMDRLEEAAEIATYATKHCADSKSALSDALCFNLGLIAFRLSRSNSERERIVTRLRKREFFRNVTLDFLSAGIDMCLADIDGSDSTRALRFISARLGFGIALSWLTVEEAGVLHQCETIPYAALQHLLDRAVSVFRDHFDLRSEDSRIKDR